jgi:sugar phosphate isomerase/epimerase
MKNAVGVIVSIPSQGSVLQVAQDMGLNVVQPCCWDEAILGDVKRAAEVRRESEQVGIVLTSLWAGWPGPTVWDFQDGPLTLGVVPTQYRVERVAALKKAGDFAKELGVPAIVTHLGFIPENAKDPLFQEVVDAVREIAVYLKSLGLEFWFETGQETPVTMLRLIQCVGTGNLGVNLDPANLILYGKGSPVDSLDVFGSYVRSIHAKDGLYPTDPMKLGREVKVGEGRVRFPELVKRLGEIGFDGAFIIEREISGEQQRRDIKDTVVYLESLLKEHQQ